MPRRGGKRRAAAADGAEREPGASDRAKAMRGLEQEFRVASGGWLESWPELFIPQGGARYRQRTTVRVEEGGEAAAHRDARAGPRGVGRGVCLCGAGLGDGRVSRRSEDRPRALSRSRRRARRSRRCGRNLPEAYYASCFVVSPQLRADADCWRRIHDLHSDEAWVGCSALVRGGWAIRVLAAGSIALRKTIAQVRRELYAALGAREPALRRN